MIFERRDEIVTPHGASAIWRYMTHERFVSMMREGYLYFANAKRLSDQYEITLPASTIKAKRKALSAAGYSGSDLEEELERFHWANNPMKDLTLVNCWSLRSAESYALWKIYLRGQPRGVAVRSTVSRLRRAIEGGNDPYGEPFFVGKVEYRSYLPESGLTRFQVICTKKPFYDFENELRAFILHNPRSEGGVRPPYKLLEGRRVRVDLGALVDRVYASPFENSSYERQVGSIVRSISRTIDIRPSQIQDS